MLFKTPQYIILQSCFKTSLGGWMVEICFEKWKLTQI